MQKEYTFEFIGTKEEFLNSMNSYSNNTSYGGDKFYYLDDYIIKVVGDTIHFGVERGGHSGGYWFIPSISEYEDRIEFIGTVKYIGPEDDRGKIQKVIDDIGYVVLAFLVLPIFVIIRLYQASEWVIRKLLKREKQKPKTTEEKLFDLMANHLGCTWKA